MAVPTTPGPAAARVVGSLVDEIEGEIDAIVEGIGERMREEIPDFRRVPAESISQRVRGNILRALAALRELRAPTDEELELPAAVGRERADQGLTVDAVLHAYRITVTAIWSRFGDLARQRGADVASVLAFSETLWVWADAVMDVAAASHREVELEHAREEQQRRDAFVIAVLLGTLDAADLAREGATFGLDPEREYTPFRARAAADGAPAHRLAMSLAGEDGMATGLDRDVAGIAARTPSEQPRVVIGVGPAARLEALPAAFGMASRALQTALAFGQEGAFSLADLSIRPAILADEALGDAFATRYLTPLADLGRLGADLESTLQTWFDQGMRIEDTARALHIHPNTLRHRLRRFEEATGATLREPRHLVELWWALERRRLAG
ncbi:MAG TPA: helix-turn-helix domain-containing protein [Solirubrobacteraceae bacterium]|nr:helix-turn-helix domain-containing protein [Solirubrobacteraceae bacterium]